MKADEVTKLTESNLSCLEKNTNVPYRNSHDSFKGRGGKPEYLLTILHSGVHKL
jgi:hypothetical protein